MNMLDKAESCFVDFFSAACAQNKWHRHTQGILATNSLGLQVHTVHVIFLFHLFVVQYLLFQRAPCFDVSICRMIQWLKVDMMIIGGGMAYTFLKIKAAGPVKTAL